MGRSRLGQDTIRSRHCDKRMRPQGREGGGHRTDQPVARTGPQGPDEVFRRAEGHRSEEGPRPYRHADSRVHQGVPVDLRGQEGPFRHDRQDRCQELLCRCHLRARLRCPEGLRQRRDGIPGQDGRQPGICGEAVCHAEAPARRDEQRQEVRPQCEEGQHQERPRACRPHLQDDLRARPRQVLRGGRCRSHG